MVIITMVIQIKKNKINGNIIVNTSLQFSYNSEIYAQNIKKIGTIYSPGCCYNLDDLLCQAFYT